MQSIQAFISVVSDATWGGASSSDKPHLDKKAHASPWASIWVAHRHISICLSLQPDTWGWRAGEQHFLEQHQKACTVLNLTQALQPST